MARHRTRGCGYGAVMHVVVVVLLVMVMSVTGDRNTLKQSLNISELRKFVTSDPVEYSPINVTSYYNSSSDFNPKAMQELYTVTNFFIHLVQPDDIYPEGFVEVRGGRLRSAELSTEWDALLKHYVAVLSLAAVGLVFVVLMPIVGLIFCCCRCSGCCGARAQPFEKQRDPCKRITLGIFLGIIGVIMLFGVVCAFVTNEYMEDGIVTIPTKLNVAVNDTNHYLQNTKEEIEHLLIKNFGELSNGLDTSLSSGAEELSGILVNFSKADVIYKLDDMVKVSKTVETDLVEVKKSVANLQTTAANLSDELKATKNTLMTLLQNCNKTDACRDLLNQEVATMDTVEDLDQLPDIDKSLEAVKKVTALQSNVDDGKKSLNDIKDRINETIHTHLPEISKTIADTGNAIKEIASNLTDVMNNVTKLMDSETKPLVKDLDGYIQEYAPYRYYIGIAMSSVLLLVILCITVGLFYGFCGKRPDSAYGDDCCNKGTGARFLMLGVYVMFVFSAFLMIATLVLFLFGVATEKVVCQSLRSPNDSQLLLLIDKVAPLNFGSGGNLSLTSVLSSCHMNNSIYNVLQVSDILNIQEVLTYMDKFNINKTIEELQNSIQLSGPITLLDEEMMNELLSVGDSADLDLSNITSMNISVVANLSCLAEKLDAAAEELKGVDPATELKDQAMHLRELQNNTVKGMIDQIKKLKCIGTSIEDRLKFNKSSLSAAVEEIVDEVVDAQTYLEKLGSVTMTELANTFADNIVRDINDYMNRVVNYTMNEVGHCGPISNVFNATLVATCDEILNPFNGFWASIGWCLVLFIPAIILSVKLASLYRKSDPYHAPVPDSEYLYDAYADRDNIPLANGPDKKNHHRRYNETYDNSSGYLGDYNAHLGRGERDRRDRGGTGHYPPDDARYTDMAPKEDTDNNGLPKLTTDHLVLANNQDYEDRHVLSGLPKLTTDNIQPNEGKDGKPATLGRPKLTIDDLKQMEETEYQRTLSGLPKLTTDNVQTKERKVNRILSGLPKLTRSVFESIPNKLKNSFGKKHATEPFTSLPRLNADKEKPTGPGSSFVA